MDIISHGLWTGAAGKAVNKYSKKEKISVGWAAFWGIFPDLFAFTIPFAWLFYNLASGRMNPPSLPGPNAVEPLGDHHLFGNGGFDHSYSIFYLASLLYRLSHSAVIFALIVSLVILVMRLRAGSWKIPWEMFGWLFHIILDIPTHTYNVFPTPVFWPIWSWEFGGFSWATPWFLILDYAALAAVYYFLWRRSRNADN